ncbi:universal stress protein [Neptunomonas phycophila]|uniref:universal stress protein n=1 Tax=Neptunomonas phycophila TaxID=1572645 RepID=UPI0026E283BB|nr:universal stress protein [Neptunomonas phycophila]MDO6467035.1 universal stress protein [Neptunomonas phycophila]
MNKIITCLDGSAFSNAVCSAGIWAANKLSKPLLLLHAIEKENVAAAEDLSGAIGLGARSSLLKEMAALDEQRSKVALEMGKEMLANAQTIAEQQGCAQIEQTQRHSDIVEAICDLESDARLIVIGRSGQRNKPDFNAIGSHIEQVIRQVHTPVLIANKDFSAPKSFMLAYDGRETADKTVKRIIEGGLLHGMTCHLVTVKNKQSGLMEKFKATEKMLRDSGFDVKASFLEDAIFAGLMDYKTNNGVDMLVMGAFSHSKLAQAFLGSNTLKMIENTHLPMLILR